MKSTRKATKSKNDETVFEERTELGIYTNLT
jgi:hypothetical protein